ncbi:MAG: hypothetical protein U0Y10_14550 [Spirosomataceae bacterium]
MRKIAFTTFVATSFWYYFAFMVPLVANGQDDGWRVWVKVSPCSGRFDWVTVAKNNPTGGLNYYYLANQIFPSAGCTLQGCTFATASSVAASLRTSSEFSKYCCRDYSVWQNTQTGKMSVVVGKFGTAGLGWQLVKGDLCCEEAEALSGISGACSGSNQQVINNTQCWPGSYAAWNAQTQRVECFCNPGLVWNSTKTACVTPEAQKVDCSGYPGSYAVWNDQNKRYECWCPEGKTWNSTRTACVDIVSQVSCWPGSYAAINPQTGKTECYCNPGLVWNSTKTACVTPEAQKVDCSGYPGSYAVWNDQNKRYECWCPEGKTWNSTRTACVDIVSQVSCWPGSYAAINPQTGKTECYCNPGLVWNSTKTACVTPEAQKVDCSGYPGSYAVWSDQNKRYECWCPEGKTWNSTRTACVDIVSQVSCWPGSYAAINPQTGKTECYCNPGLVWNSTKTACVQPGNNNGNGSPVWTLVSTTYTPTTPGQGWTFNASGTAHLDVYNGDKADFQWTPPPSQFGMDGFTISVSTTGTPAPNSRIAALISIGGSGIESDTPSDQRSAYATPPNGPASAQKSVTFKPYSSTSEIEVRISLMWGGITFYYKYKRTP